MDRSLDSHLSPFYLALFYVLGPLAALLLALIIAFGHVQQAFDAMSKQALREMEARAATFELALEGFVNVIAIVQEHDDRQIRAYARGLRQLYPEIYMFEIATRVVHAERDVFERSMQAQGYRDFSIHGFDYEASRQLRALAERPFYYPIRFIEPESAATMPVLGLDLGSTSKMHFDAANQSLTAPRAVASSPFELLEGGLGYVIYRPVSGPVSTTGGEEDLSALQAQEMALLVIRVVDLLPRWLQHQDRYRIRLAYPQASAGADGWMLSGSAQDASAVHWLTDLRTLQYVAVLNNRSQPFELTLTTLVRGSDLSSIWLILVFFSGTLLCFYGAHLVKQYSLRKSRVIEEQQQLYHKANFDTLTRLPNINLLLDRAEQAMRMADRSNGKVGICYLDINKFKQINDSLGHQIGDRALVEIATRLTTVLRAEDTAARIHGDEFVILLPELDDGHALRQVSAKILAIFDQPFAIAEPALLIGGSIGSALYPDDANDLEALLHISDERMYSHKQPVDYPLAQRPATDLAELATNPERMG